MNDGDDEFAFARDPVPYHDEVALRMMGQGLSGGHARTVLEHTRRKDIDKESWFQGATHWAQAYPDDN
jgi:hypothetical protein